VLLEAMRRRLSDKDAKRAVTLSAPPVSPIDNPKLVRDLDLTQRLDKAQYETKREKLQGALNALVRDRRFRKRSLILVFEGSDAAGKGGAIRRLTAALDARQSGIVPVAAPTEEERAQPYLWRFWRHVPRQGRVAIFDRSWYGRVLVERVESFCGDADWMRAYAEINDFEEQLVESGVVVCKFWLQISKKMQLSRFREREKTGFKRFKITDEDWRNREKWGAYEAAVADMVDRTSTGIAPWTLVEAEDKLFARVKVLRTVVERLKDSL
jgi:polyphosphate kinase 2 (PPK2 family)